MNKRTSMALIVFAVVIILVVGGNAFIKDRQQKARYASQLELTTQLGNICEGTGSADAAAYRQAKGLQPIVYATQSPIGFRDNTHYYTPLTWKPDSLAEMALVACIVEDEVELEQCSYELPTGSLGVIVRAQYQVVITLREAQTSSVVATSDAIKGDIPRECQASEEFKSGELTQYVMGARASDEIDKWLQPFVEMP